ncbi:MAG TPA: PqqD family protein [Acidimicrobiales bacterium]|nr:PqqD family protein [Acidimicrobiales bacterium]
MASKPKRKEGVVHRELSEGVVTLDSETREAHSLTPTAAQVWLACDGKRSPRALAEFTGLEVDSVEETLVALDDAHLLAPASVGGGMTRRAVLAGGAGVGVAVVTSIVLPTPAMASSGGPPPTTTVPPSTSTAPQQTTTTVQQTTTTAQQTTTTAQSTTTAAPSTTTGQQQSTTTAAPVPPGSNSGGQSGTVGQATPSSPASSTGALAFTGVNARNEVAVALGLVAAGGVIAATAKSKAQPAVENVEDAG